MSAVLSSVVSHPVLHSVLHPVLHTFDVLLFAGSDVFPSRLIEWALGTQYSHIGIVVVNPTFCEVPAGTYFIESGEETTPDASTGRRKWGVRLTALDDEFVASYPGRIFVRTMHWKTTTEHKDNNRLELLASAWKEAHAATYDCNVVDALETDRGRVLFDRDGRRTDEFVCSTFASFILSRIGVIEADIAWDTLSPREFAPGNRIDSLMSKKNVASLESPPVLLAARQNNV